MKPSRPRYFLFFSQNRIFLVLFRQRSHNFESRGSEYTYGVDDNDKPDIEPPNLATPTTSGFVRTARVERDPNPIRIYCQNPIVFTYNRALSGRNARLICMALSSSARDAVGSLLASEKDISALNQTVGPDRLYAAEISGRS